jgi:hypothetical protein
MRTAERNGKHPVALDAVRLMLLTGLRISEVQGPQRLVFRWDGGRGEAEGVYLDDHSYK